MASAGEYVLFDLPSKGRASCWSPNTWKIRLLFAYKGLPYRTQWVEYPDIASTLKALNVPPNPDEPDPRDNVPYTVPAVTFPDGTTVMDSGVIATRINAEHPDPPMLGLPAHSSDPHQPGALESANPGVRSLAQVKPMVSASLAPLMDRAMPRIVEELINDVSRPHREAKAKKQLGVSLAEAKARFNPDEAWPKVHAEVTKLGRWVQEQGGAPWVGGEGPAWVDFLLVSLLEFMRHCEQDIFDRIVRDEGAAPIKKLYDTAKEKGWLSKDD